MKKKNNLIYLIAAFTLSKNVKKNEVFASIQYRYDFFDNINWNDVKYLNNILRSDETLEIYHVLRDSFKEEIEPIKSTIYQSLDKNDRLKTIDYNKIPDHYFFTTSYINDLFFNDFSPYDNISTKIFCFEDMKWKILVNRFKDL